jgi:hypothetical protein
MGLESKGTAYPTAGFWKIALYKLFLEIPISGFNPHGIVV